MFHRTYTPDALITKFSPSGERLWSTYLGGSDEETVTALATDSNGDIYVSGSTMSSDFPFTQTTTRDGSGYLAKISSDGTRLLYATRIRSPANALAIGSDFTIYLCGSVANQGGAGRIFLTGYVTRLTPDGRSVVYDNRDNLPDCYDLQIEADGTALASGAGYIRLLPEGTRRSTPVQFGHVILTSTFSRQGDWFTAGTHRSQGGPPLTTPGAFQTTPPVFGAFDTSGRSPRDATVARLGPDGALRYATLLGGTQMEQANGIVVDEDGNAIVAGFTDSPDFPTRSLIDMHPGRRAGFIAKFNRNASDLFFSTPLRDFIPAGIFPHPEGGWWLVGSGIPPGAELPVESIMLMRVEETEATLPRIDQITVADNRYTIQGAGFTSDARVLFNDRAVTPESATPVELRVEGPAELPAGSVVRVEVEGKQSRPVRVR